MEKHWISHGFNSLSSWDDLEMVIDYCCLIKSTSYSTNCPGQVAMAAKGLSKDDRKTKKERVGKSDTDPH